MLGLILFEFSHIEYDPPGNDKNREWVEMRNISPDSIDLSKYFLFENNTNHKINAVDSAIVPPNTIAIIASDAATFVAENPTRSAFVFDSTFSLSNTGEYLALKDASTTIIAETTYTAAPKPVVEKKKSTTKATTKAKVSKESPKILERATSSLPAAAADSAPWSMVPWFAGLIGTVLTAGIALFAVTKPAGTGYTIEES
ncbi:MAG: lamin tail domain-containing protein [Patescibacteria group bacterium]